MSNAREKTQRSGRLQLFLVAAIFLGPLAIAAYLYFSPSEWRPDGRTNNGMLIQPVVTLPEESLATPHGGVTGNSFFRGKWSLLYLERDDCGELCRETIVKIRQIRRALGGENDRLQRVFLFGGAIPEKSWFDAGHEGLIYADPATGFRLADTLSVFDTGLYIVDPLGNLLMRYPIETESKPIYQDLKKLLKLSRIG